jgi:hypothetical protein
MALLADILSLELLPIMIQDRILMLRLVSRTTLTALESNASIPVNLRIKNSGLTAGFLKRWCGDVRLHCTHRLHPGSRWFREIRDALVTGQLKPLGLLSLSIEGYDLLPLIEMLVEIGPAIRQLEITYRGNGTELLAVAAPLASLGRTLAMNISVQGKDSAGTMSSWMHRLLDSNITINSLTLRSSTPSPVYTSGLAAQRLFFFEDVARYTHSPSLLGRK